MLWFKTETPVAFEVEINTLKDSESVHFVTNCGHSYAVSILSVVLEVVGIRLDIITYFFPIQCTDNLGCFLQGEKVSSHYTALLNIFVSFCPVYSVFVYPYH